MGGRESSEDYLEAILVIRRLRGSCRNVDIAERMGVAKPSVTKALGNLARRGLAEVVGRDVRLTEEGGRLAEATLDKHRFFERLLVESGVDAETASAEACRMEHCLSEDSYRRFAAYLGSRRAAARLSPCRTITSFNRPRPNGWVPFTRVYLGQRAEKNLRKATRRTRNTKHDKRGERQMPDPGRQHRGREAFQPQPNNSSY